MPARHRDQESEMTRHRHGLAWRPASCSTRELLKYLRAAFVKLMGHSGDMFPRGIAGTVKTWPGLDNCNRNFPRFLRAIKRGVLATGAMPLDFPAIHPGEAFANRTGMKFRNRSASRHRGDNPRPVSGCSGADRRFRLPLQAPGRHGRRVDRRSGAGRLRKGSDGAGSVGRTLAGC